MLDVFSPSSLLQSLESPTHLCPWSSPDLGSLCWTQWRSDSIRELSILIVSMETITGRSRRCPLADTFGLLNLGRVQRGGPGADSVSADGREGLIVEGACHLQRSCWVSCTGELLSRSPLSPSPPPPAAAAPVLTLIRRKSLFIHTATVRSD